MITVPASRKALWRAADSRALRSDAAIIPRSTCGQTILRPPRRTDEMAFDLLIPVGTAGFEPATPGPPAMHTYPCDQVTVIVSLRPGHSHSSAGEAERK